jgi:hypothetical protein
VVLGSETRKNTKGQIFRVNDFKLMKRAQYGKLGNPLAITTDLRTVPLEVYKHTTPWTSPSRAERIRMRRSSLPRPRPAEVIGVKIGK